MKAKKIAILGVTGALAACVAVGGILAWFTDKADTSTTGNTGHVDISATSPDLSKETLMPGDKIALQGKVKVEAGSADAYLRVQVPTVAVKSDDVDTTLPLGDFAANFGADWVVKGAYAYYTKPVAANAVVDVLAATNGVTMTIPTTWKNAYADAAVSLAFQAEAVQAKNFTPDFTADAPWGGLVAADIETYVAPTNP